jgi:aryl-alcohol dehydrogenase-like predicted oxidoreductase
MKFAKFGTTDLMVSRIGFGMWPIGGTIKSGDYGVTDLDQSILAVQQALDLGISLFDAAPAYGNGLAEEVLGKGLKGRREDAIISTKCGIYYDFEKEWKGSQENNIKYTGLTRSKDKLYLHSP